MNPKFLIRAIGLGLLVGLVIYTIFRLLGLQTNSTMIGAITGGIVGAMGANRFINRKHQSK